MSRPLFLLLIGLFLGLFGDFLLGSPPGVNFTLWVAAFLVVSAWTTSISPVHSGLALPSLFFAGCLSWRESTFLAACNALAVFLLAVLPHLQHAGIELRNAFVSDYLRGMRRVWRHIWTGSTTYFTKELPIFSAGSSWPWQRHGRAVLIGCALAVPVLSVFGALFSSADPAFRQLVQSLSGVNPASTFRHVACSGMIGVAAIGYLRGLTGRDFAEGAGDLSRHAGRYGFIEIAIPLGGLITMSAIFVVLQIPYLFGGKGLVMSNVDLSYAGYARRGFFELTAAAALVVPVLLLADKLLRYSAATTRAFRILALVQIGLVGVLMASALDRMGLYWSEYGLTTTRVYATAFMLWIGSVLAWFGMTVLRGRRHRFAFGALVSGLLALATLNFANPEHLIARANIERGRLDGSTDTRYLASLSADAYPSLIEHLDRVPAAERCQVLSSMRSRVEMRGRNWRGWTIASQRARYALAQVRPMVFNC